MSVNETKNERDYGSFVFFMNRSIPYASVEFHPVKFSDTPGKVIASLSEEEINNIVELFSKRK